MYAGTQIGQVEISTGRTSTICCAICVPPSSNETVPVGMAVRPVIAALKASADPTIALPAEEVRATVGLVRLFTESRNEHCFGICVRDSDIR